MTHFYIISTVGSFYNYATWQFIQHAEVFQPSFRHILACKCILEDIEAKTESLSVSIGPIVTHCMKRNMDTKCVQFSLMTCVFTDQKVSGYMIQYSASDVSTLKEGGCKFGQFVDCNNFLLYFSATGLCFQASKKV